MHDHDTPQPRQDERPGLVSRLISALLIAALLTASVRLFLMGAQIEPALLALG